MAGKFERKIIRIGETSYGIVLPISWLRYYNLKNGDTVQVISNGEIKIKPMGDVDAK